MAVNKRLPEEGLPGAGAVSDASFGGAPGAGGGSAMGEMGKVLSALTKAEPQVQFLEGGRVIMDRAVLEMAFSAYTDSMQTPEVYNKWLSLDEKMNKALRQYKSDIRLLIAGVAQQGQAQAMVQDQIPGQGGAEAPPAPAPTPAPSQAAAGKTLPTR